MKIALFTDSSGFNSITKEGEPILCDGPHWLIARDVIENYAADLVHRYNTHPDVLAALLAVEKLFATPGYYIGTRDGADPLAIDATMLLVAQAVRAAKGGA